MKTLKLEIRVRDAHEAITCLLDVARKLSGETHAGDKVIRAGRCVGKWIFLEDSMQTVKDRK